MSTGPDVDRIRVSPSKSSCVTIGRFDCGPLAQLVEHLPFKQRVAGSSPARLIDNKELSPRAISGFVVWVRIGCVSVLRVGEVARITQQLSAAAPDTSATTECAWLGSSTCCQVHLRRLPGAERNGS